LYLRSAIRCVRLFPLRLPLRRSFRHAAHTRNEADPVVVQVELADGTCGYGETLPRDYVTGEIFESLVRTVREELLDRLVAMRPERLPDALEEIAALPERDSAGRIITAARAGIELALLDAYSRYFHKPISQAVGWFGLPGFGPPASLRKVRYSGVLSGDDIGRLGWSTRIMRWFGLRDFKLKVGYTDDEERIRCVQRVLGRSLGRTRTLRLDANAAWTLERAIEVLAPIQDVPIAAVEQPFPPGDDAAVQALKRAVNVTVMHDESLVTLDDAERLIGAGIADAFNIRLSKNGGLLPSLRLAHLARRHGVMFQLGCMVGETGILSAAGRRFLENVPGVTFAEGSYGRFLLRQDVTRPAVRFGYGGWGHPLPEPGWGVTVDTDALRRFTQPGVIEMHL
jgi:L-Ala-D/L-Glu epimerase